MEEILKSHPVSTLKMEISKTNIKGYSKMKKAEVIKLMLKHKERFKHIKYNEDKKEKDEEKRLNQKSKRKMDISFLRQFPKSEQKEKLKQKRFSYLTMKDLKK